MLAGWGSLGQVAITDTSGTVHWRADAEPGTIIGWADRFETLYP